MSKVVVNENIKEEIKSIQDKKGIKRKEKKDTSTKDEDDESTPIGHAKKIYLDLKREVRKILIDLEYTIYACTKEKSELSVSDINLLADYVHRSKACGDVIKLADKIAKYDASENNLFHGYKLTEYYILGLNRIIVIARAEQEKIYPKESPNLQKFIKLVENSEKEVIATRGIMQITDIDYGDIWKKKKVDK